MGQCVQVSRCSHQNTAAVEFWWSCFGMGKRYAMDVALDAITSHVTGPRTVIVQLETPGFAVPVH